MDQQGQGQGRAAAEQIFVGLIQAVGANTALITSLIAEIKGLRDDLKAKDGLSENIGTLVDNTANLGEDVEALTGGFRVALDILRETAEAGKKGRVNWNDIADIFTRIELQAQQDEAEEEEEEEAGVDGEGEHGQEIFPPRS